MTTPSGGLLAVRGESIQRIFGWYLNDKFLVNRRYQRKLVWSVEEKQRLIDSAMRDLPIPLFLVAEIGGADDAPFELIDGLQRLNAIFSFLENEFAVGGEYFDLDTLADTKLLKDDRKVLQKAPIMSREKSARIANYTLALSVYRASSIIGVEDVFRRINSGGRRLQRQGLRQAGTISSLADLVRIVSSRVRGDTSPGDIVALRAMPQLSITNYNLPYGVPVEEIFWVKEGILRREDVRESLDEQLVLDILIDMLIDPITTSGTRLRDDYYSYTESTDDAETRASISINHAIDAYGKQQVEDHFLRVYDAMREVLGCSDKRFSLLIGAGSGGRSPRYFHAVFIAFYELFYRDRMRLRDPSRAVQKLQGIGAGSMSVPAGGGDWGRESKRLSIDVVKGVVRDAFEPSTGAEDLGRYGRASELETLLGNALVEQQLLDCKQGFLSLGQDRVFDEGSFSKICQTLSAMANAGPGCVGYVAVGIADDASDANRVKQLDGVKHVLYRQFHIVGIGREAALRGESLNTYWSWIMQRILSSGLDPRVARRVATDSRLVNYRDQAVALFRVTGLGEPSFFNKNELYERRGSELNRAEPADYMRIYQRFTTGQHPSSEKQA